MHTLVVILLLCCPPPPACGARYGARAPAVCPVNWRALVGRKVKPPRLAPRQYVRYDEVDAMFGTRPIF